MIRCHLLRLLSLAALSSLFLDTSYIPIISIFQPTFYLAYCKSCRIWYEYLLGWMVVSVFRAVPARDYFYFGVPGTVAYAQSWFIIWIVYGLVMVINYAQCWVWMEVARANTSIESLQPASDANENSVRGAASEGLTEANTNNCNNSSTDETTSGADATTATFLENPTPVSSNSPNKLVNGFESHLGALVYPLLSTALYQIIFRFSPIGGAGNPAMGMSSVLGLRQVASVAGEIFLVFWIGWLAVIIVGCLGWLDKGGAFDSLFNNTLKILCSPFGERHVIESQTNGLNMTASEVPKCHLYFFAFLTAIMFVYGSTRELVGRGMYLQDISLWPTTQASAAPLRVSCLTRAESRINEDDSVILERMIRRTNERLAAGDDLILWSEASVNQSVTPEMFQWNSTENLGAVVAPTFMDTISDDNGLEYNSVSMMQNGVVIARYDKNRPVPVVESGVLGGLVPPKPFGVEFWPQQTTNNVVAYDDDTDQINAHVPKRQLLSLDTAMAICFDFDFPDLLLNAHAADLVIGPSWYWASIGYNFWGHNIFRAIENGFTLIKCAENGISGAVDPYGRTLVALPTSPNEVHLMEVPVQSGVTTAFGKGGWFFGWICVLLSPVVLIFFIARKRTCVACKWKCFKSYWRRAEYSDLPPVADREGTRV